MLDMKSSFEKFSPGKESMRVFILKLGMFFKKSKLLEFNPERTEYNSSFVDVWKGS